MFGGGPARRFVGEMNPAGINAFEIIPGGQSGLLGSPFYANMLGRWLTNGYHPLLLTEEQVNADQRSEETFVP
jgi:penicillin amidase